MNKQAKKVQLIKFITHFFEQKSTIHLRSLVLHFMVPQNHASPEILCTISRQFGSFIRKQNKSTTVDVFGHRWWVCYHCRSGSHTLGLFQWIKKKHWQLPLVCSRLLSLNTSKQRWEKRRRVGKAEGKVKCQVAELAFVQQRFYNAKTSTVLQLQSSLEIFLLK